MNTAAPPRRRFNYQRIAQARQPKPRSSTRLTLLIVLLLALVLFARSRQSLDAEPLPPAVAEAAEVMETPPLEAVAEPEPAAPPSPQAAMLLPTALSAAAPEVPPPNMPSGLFWMERDALGHFVGTGLINGDTVKLLADTGAAQMTIPGKIADQLGLRRDTPVPVMTAAGKVIHYSATLETLTLGSIVLRNVPVAIAPDMSDDAVMLGLDTLTALNMKVDSRGLQLSRTAAAATPIAPRFKLPLSACLKPGNQFDQQTLNCMNGV